MTSEAGAFLHLSSLPQGTVSGSEEPQEARLGAWSFLPRLVLCYVDTIVYLISLVKLVLAPLDVRFVPTASPPLKRLVSINPLMSLAQLPET